jgi:hypothetical protein
VLIDRIFQADLLGQQDAHPKTAKEVCKPDIELEDVKAALAGMERIGWVVR